MKNWRGDGVTLWREEFIGGVSLRSVIDVTASCAATYLIKETMEYFGVSL